MYNILQNDLFTENILQNDFFTEGCKKLYNPMRNFSMYHLMHEKGMILTKKKKND